MRENRFKIAYNQIECNTTNLRKVFKIISTSILILAFSMALFLPFRPLAVNAALEALVPGVPVDDNITTVNTTETSQFQTPNDPIDDSIEYVHDGLATDPDTFEYEICDDATPTPVCVPGTVNITVGTTTLSSTLESPQTLSAEAINAPSAVTDNATVLFNSWVNIDVLANDDWGADGPGTSAIRLGGDCVSGSDGGNCITPTEGVATVNTGPRSPDPTGLAYLDGHPTADYTDKLLISDSEVNEIYPDNPAAYAGVNLFITNLNGDLMPTLDGSGKYYRLTTIISPPQDYTDEPTGVAYNPSNHHLFFTDDNHNRIHEVDPGADGLYGTGDDVTTFIDTDSITIGSTDPSGITFYFDESLGANHLIIVDEVLEEVFDIELVGETLASGIEAVTHFDTASIGIMKPEGIAFNPDNDHLYIASAHWTNYIAETTLDGKLFRYLDLSGVPTLSNMSGLAYIPQANGSETNTLYVVDRNVDNNPTPLAGSPVLLGDPSENDGKMFEVTFDRNAPPHVDAGLDQTISFPYPGPAIANLTGIMIDDGLPNPPSTVTTSWTAVSGPGIVTFGDASALNTTVSFPVDGDYTLRLTAWDEDRPTTIPGDPYDDVIIHVTQAENQAPSVDAGPPQIITLPNIANLDGTVSDDGLPNPPGALTTDWVKLSGPGMVTFGNANLVDTTASFSTGGVYVLRLTADDDELTASDTVTITVNPAPLQEVWLPLILKQ